MLNWLRDKIDERKAIRDGKKLCEWLNANPGAPLEEFKVELQRNGYVCVGISLNGSTEIYKKGSQELTLEYAQEERL